MASRVLNPGYPYLLFWTKPSKWYGTFSPANSIICLNYSHEALSKQKGSKCMCTSCKLKDPVTTAAVCSTGHMAWDYAVLVGHRGSHRWLWVTGPDVSALISEMDICLLSKHLSLAPDWLSDFLHPLYLCGFAVLQSYIWHVQLPQKVLMSL